MDNSSSNKYDKIFKAKISFSGFLRFMSVIILIYIIDYALSIPDINATLAWKLIIVWGGIEVLFFFSLAKIINLLTDINKKIGGRF